MKFDGVGKYRGRPVEAVRVQTEAADGIVNWLKENGFYAWNKDGVVGFGHDAANPGDWIVLRGRAAPQVLTNEAFEEDFERG